MAEALRLIGLTQDGSLLTVLLASAVVWMTMTVRQLRADMERNHREHNRLRQENREEHAQMRKENREEHAQMRQENREEHARLRQEHAQLRQAIIGLTDKVNDIAKDVAVLRDRADRPEESPPASVRAGQA